MNDINMNDVNKIIINPIEQRKLKRSTKIPDGGIVEIPGYDNNVIDISAAGLGLMVDCKDEIINVVLNIRAITEGMIEDDEKFNIILKKVRKNGSNITGWEVLGIPKNMFIKYEEQFINILNKEESKLDEDKLYMLSQIYQILDELRNKFKDAFVAFSKQVLNNHIEKEAFNNSDEILSQ